MAISALITAAGFVTISALRHNPRLAVEARQTRYQTGSILLCLLCLKTFISL